MGKDCIFFGLVRVGSKSESTGKGQKRFTKLKETSVMF